MIVGVLQLLVTQKKTLKFGADNMPLERLSASVNEVVTAQQQARRLPEARDGCGANKEQLERE